MLRNSVDLEELKNRRSFPKNNYFCYKWRIKDHFNRSIDRQIFHLRALGASNDVSLMNDRIMQLYKSSFGSSRKDLIVDLARDAMSFLDRRRSDQKRQQAKELRLSTATIELVQYASNVLLGFSTELNSLMGLSELFITASEPEAKKLGACGEGITHVVQAGFSTNSFRLVIEGRLECINFYLVPADSLLTLNEIAMNYEPLEKWRSLIGDTGAVQWYSGGQAIAEDMVEVICSELLRALLAATQERLMPELESVAADESFFELSAPAPWELDLACRKHCDGELSNGQMLVASRGLSVELQPEAQLFNSDSNDYFYEALETPEYELGMKSGCYPCLSSAFSTTLTNVDAVPSEVARSESVCEDAVELYCLEPAENAVIENCPSFGAWFQDSDWEPAQEASKLPVQAPPVNTGKTLKKKRRSRKGRR